MMLISISDHLRMSCITTHMGFCIMRHSLEESKTTREVNDV